MISFNIPPYTGKEIDYIKEAVASQKICGDGQFTKKCSAWMEERTGSSKVLLTTSCTHLWLIIFPIRNHKIKDHIRMCWPFDHSKVMN